VFFGVQGDRSLATLSLPVIRKALLQFGVEGPPPFLHALTKDVEHLHDKLLPLWNAIAGDNLPANVRFRQEAQGRRAGVPRAPMSPTSAAQAGPIRQALAYGGLV
jgi:hypothetical protein